MSQNVKIIGKGFIGKYLKYKKNWNFFNRFSLDNYSSLDYGENNIYIFTAGMSKPDECNSKPLLLKKIIDGTIQSIKEISKNNKVVFLSSDAVLGKYTEYSKSKILIEKSIENLNNVKIVRLSYIISNTKEFYDPFMLYANSQNAEIFDNFKRNIIHIDDVSDGLEFIISNWDKAPKITNLSGNSTISKSKVLDFYNIKYNIVKEPEGFYDNRDATIFMEPNFYVPKINFV